MGTFWKSSFLRIHPPERIWSCNIFFWKKLRGIQTPGKYHLADICPEKLKIGQNLAGTRFKKSKKIDFFRFFTNTFEIIIHIKISLKNTFWRPKSSFSAIYHHSGRYQPLCSKSIFRQKMEILVIFRNFDVARNWSEYCRK